MSVRKGRGKGFTVEECLGLARAWVEQTQDGYQPDQHMWDGIREICHTKYGIDRSAGSLRTTWSKLSRDCHLYLSAKAHVRRTVIAGTAEDISKLVMRQYRRRAAVSDKTGVLRDAAPFKFVRVAEFLEMHPKFGGDTLSRPRVSVTPQRRPASALDPDDNLALEPAPVAATRDIRDNDLDIQYVDDRERRPPVGKKKAKAPKPTEELTAATEAINRIQQSFSEGNEILAGISKRMEEQVTEQNSLALLNSQIQLLQALPRDSNETPNDAGQCDAHERGKNAKA